MDLRAANWRLRASCILIYVSLAILLLTHSIEAAEMKDVDLYALVVGLEKYKDPSLKRTPMAAAAAQLHDFLVERRGLFRKVKVALLLDEKATKANIVKVLKEELRAARKDDVVLIFMNAHGFASEAEPGKFYFTPYDGDPKDPSTRLQLNDKSLFENIKSERLLFATGSCFSGGFLAGLAKGVKVGEDVDFLGQLQGRFGVSAAAATEQSWNTGKYGMDLFGYYFIKGLRGAADTSNDGKITVKKLFDYLSQEVEKETFGAQHPQLFVAKGNPSETTIYEVPTYSKDLDIKVNFFHEADDKKVKLITEETVLKSGQHLGVAFRAESDCYVYIYWWDSTGGAGELFPNPQLTEGTGEVKAGQTYWLPSKDGERWYVLDKNPGTETIYFAATRTRNEKLENLMRSSTTVVASSADKIQRQPQSETAAQDLSLGTKPAKRTETREQATGEMERELSLMGFAAHTVPKGAQKASFESRERLVEQMENRIKVSGAEAVFKLQFQHVAP